MFYFERIIRKLFFPLLYPYFTEQSWTPSKINTSLMNKCVEEEFKKDRSRILSPKILSPEALLEGGGDVF